MKMKKKFRILFSSLFVLLLVSIADVSHAQDQPNIVLIMADYMGYADIEPFGSNEVKTP